jgi:hypothetical protein
LFGKLFRKDYPSSEWLRSESLSVDVDLDRGVLCGVPLGRNIDQLAFLGPAEDPEGARKGVLRYLSLGLEIQAVEATLSEITLILADSLGDGYQPFSGTVTRSGRKHLVTSEMNEGEAIRIFGSPTRRDEVRDEESGDLEELTLSYSSGETTWELVLGERGTLEEVRIRRS